MNELKMEEIEEQKDKEEQKYELISIETIRNEKINKILIIAVLIIVVISCSSIAGVFVADSLNNKRQNKVEEKKEKEEELQHEQVIEEKPKGKIPIYSEDAKIRMNNIYKLEEGEEKTAFLTFDDGPSESVTPRILETLKNENVKATFFVLGSRVEINPHLVKQEYEEGHYIANHGYSHEYTSIYANQNTVLDEYNHTEEKIKQAIENENYSSYLFRFPRRK